MCVTVTHTDLRRAVSADSPQTPLAMAGWCWFSKPFLVFCTPLLGLTGPRGNSTSKDIPKRNTGTLLHTWIVVRPFLGTPKSVRWKAHATRIAGSHGWSPAYRLSALVRARRGIAGAAVAVSRNHSHSTGSHPSSAVPAPSPLPSRNRVRDGLNRGDRADGFFQRLAQESTDDQLTVGLATSLL